MKPLAQGLIAGACVLTDNYGDWPPIPPDTRPDRGHRPGAVTRTKQWAVLPIGLIPKPPAGRRQGVRVVSEHIHRSAILHRDSGTEEAMTEGRREAALLKTGALQHAIFNSANFSCIATDENGVIQLFNVGAERMLGYAAADVLNKITPADISDPQEVIVRAKALSLELGTAITPGFEALVFKASRGIEDIYELTYFRKDGTRFP